MDCYDRSMKSSTILWGVRGKFTGLCVSVMLAGSLLPARQLLAKELDAQAEAKSEAVLAFEKVGFILHGEVTGFNAISRPARTQDGIIVPGTLPAAPGVMTYGLSAVWRLADGKVEILTPPEDGPGKGKPWGPVSNATASGWFSGTTYEGHTKERGHMKHAYVMSPDKGLIHLPAPLCQQIAPVDINEAGTVVGWYSPTRNWAGFVWSQKEGFIDLGKEEEETVQATDINVKGMIVGHVEGDGGYRPRIWLPPKKPGEPRVIRTLDPPEGFDEAAGADVDDNGAVLIEAIRRIPGKKPGSIYVVGKPYLWTQDKGYAELPIPDVLAASPQEISKTGDVLLRCWGKPGGAGLTGDPWDVTFYLCRGGKTIKLPNYPGAERTSYARMADDGLIACVAQFKPDEGEDHGVVVSFVISAAEDNKEEKAGPENG